MFLSVAKMRPAFPDPLFLERLQRMVLAHSRRNINVWMNEHIEEIQDSDQECASLEEILFWIPSGTELLPFATSGPGLALSFATLGPYKETFLEEMFSLPLFLKGCILFCSKGATCPHVFRRVSRVSYRPQVMLGNSVLRQHRCSQT